MKGSMMKRRRVLKMMRNVLRMSLDRRHLSTIVIRESLSVSHLTHDTDPENILNKFHFFLLSVLLCSSYETFSCLQS